MGTADGAIVKKKLPLVKLAAVGVVLAVAGLLALRGVDLRALIEQGMALIRNLGPWVFFSLMALPGMPIFGLSIPAGEAFRPQLGLSGVILAMTVAALINLALAYWLSRYALRPLLTRLIARYGYTVPRVTPENALDVTLIVRCTPGPPFALQCFVLGIAEVPFRLYMIVSFLALMPWALGGVILGQGLFQGNFKVALSGLFVLVAAVVAVQWLRRKYFTKRDR